MDPFVNEHELAETLQISTATIRKWRVSGKGPQFVKVGGTAVRYSMQAVESWLRTQPFGGERGDDRGKRS